MPLSTATISTCNIGLTQNQIWEIFRHLVQPFSELLPHQLLAHLHLVLLLAPKMLVIKKSKIPRRALPGLILEQNQ